MSGRALRRLPVLALARYIGIGTTSTALASTTTAAQLSGTKAGQASSQASGMKGADVAIWLDTMERVVQEQIFENAKLACMSCVTNGLEL